MKTAVSIPEPLFRAAEGLAERLHKSRSQRDADALAAYLTEHGQAEVTARLNDLYAEQDSGLDEVAEAMQTFSLRREDW